MNVGTYLDKVIDVFDPSPSAVWSLLFDYRYILNHDTLGEPCSNDLL